MYDTTTRIKEDRSGLNLFVRKGCQKHLAEVRIFGFTISIGGINPIVNRIKIGSCTRGMDQIDNANARNEAVFGATLLSLHQRHLYMASSVVLVG